MAVEIITCPACKQKLGVIEYVSTGAEVVCANAHCLTTLRITNRRPMKVEAVPIQETYNPDSRPESYS